MEMEMEVTMIEAGGDVSLHWAVTLKWDRKRRGKDLMQMPAATIGRFAGHSPGRGKVQTAGHGVPSRSRVTC